MIPHNNEISDLHEGCTYIYKERIFKITDLSNYPKVGIMDSVGNLLVVDANDIYHIELNDKYLDKLSDGTTVSATAPKIWYFDDQIPVSLCRSDRGWYLLFTPFNEESKDAPFSIVSVDELEHIRNFFSTNAEIIHKYEKIRRNS